MNLPLLLAAVGTAAVALGACSGSDGEQTASTVFRDSAGIRIAESVRVESGSPHWTVAESPTVSIGSVEGAPESQLYHVVGAAMLPGGGFVVANGGTYELRFYDRAGRHQRSVGREGGGPGEFLTLESIALSSRGEILAWDSGSLRLSVYSPEGDLISSQQVADDAFEFFPRFLGAFDDGSLLLTGGQDNVFRRSTRSSRPAMRLWRYSPASGSVAPVLTAAGEEQFTWGTSTFAMRTEVPYGRKTFVAVHGSEVWVADNDRYEVRVHGARGELRRIIRQERQPRPVTEEDRDAARRRSMERADARFREAVEQMVMARPFPETHPAFDGLLLDRAGHTWVRDSDGEEGSRWTVFDTAGEHLGTAELPAGLEVMEIGPDYVLGVWKDDLGVEYLRLHALREREPA